MTEIQKHLISLQDKKYSAFSSKLIPNVDHDKFIGVRVPALRSYAKELCKSGETEDFLSQLPHEYHEENMLHVFILNEIKDYDEMMARLEAFVPHINNWAVNDSVKPKCAKKHRPELLEKIKEWLKSNRPYTLRLAVLMLMDNFLDEDFLPEYLTLAAQVRSDEYYVNMMVAWYFATALAKQWDSAVKIIEGNLLDPWTHNKAIQKSIESFRVTDKHKAYLRTLKR